MAIGTDSLTPSAVGLSALIEHERMQHKFNEALTEIRKKDQALPNEKMVVEFNFGEEIVLPYETGLLFIQCLQQAESLERNSSHAYVAPLKTGAFRATPMSSTEYEQLKLAQLLNLPLDDVKRYHR